MFDVSDYLDDVFGADGLFAAHFPGYETRPGQVDLARAVDTAMRTGTHALGEGPCGTSLKSLPKDRRTSSLGSISAFFDHV